MSVYRLLIELVGKDQGATTALKSAQKEVGGLQQAAGKLQGALTAAAGIAGMAYMGKQALDLVSDLYMLGAQAMRTETAFRDLAKGAGGSADAILQAIKKASGGTVSEMDWLRFDIMGTIKEAANPPKEDKPKMPHGPRILRARR